MTDLASLSFAVDSSEARRAKTDLDALKASSTDASEQAIRLTRSFLDGKDPLATYRAELALMDQEMRRAGQGIDGLIDRLNRLTFSISGVAGPSRELRQTIGQLEAAAIAFGTSSQSMEAFVRTSRQMGLSSQEMTGALQRIQEALRGVSEEGQRARQVLANYGVSLDGRAPGSEAQVLRDLVTNMRAMRMDTRMGDEMNFALGGVSIASLAALRDPEFMTTGQRERQMRQDAEAERIATLRRNIADRGAANQRWQAEFNDLEAEYGGTWGDWARWGVDTATGTLSRQPSAARRRALEARRDGGAVSASAYERSDGYITDAFFGRSAAGALFGPALGNWRASQRAFDWVTSDEFALGGEDISARYMEESRDAPIGARFAAVGRRVQNLIGTYQTTGIAQRGRDNQRIAGLDLESQRNEFAASLTGAERAQVDRIIQAAEALGVQFTGMNPRAATPDELLERFSPDQRAAFQRLDRSVVGGALRDRSRTMAIEERMWTMGREGVTAFDAARYGIENQFLDGSETEQEAERAQRIARVVVQAETEIIDVNERSARIKLEVLNIDRQIARAREDATRATERQARQTSEQSNIIEQAMGVGGGGAAFAGPALRLFAAQQQSNRPGGASVESILLRGFEDERGAVNRQILTARRQGEDRAYRLGELRAGTDEVSIADAERVNDATRGMRENVEALGRILPENNQKYQEALRLLRDAEATIKAQLEAERQITSEINLQIMGRRTAAMNADTAVAARDPDIASRNLRTQRERIAISLLSPEEQRSADAADIARRRLRTDEAFAGRVQQQLDAQTAAATEAGRLDREARGRLAAVPRTGNPILDRNANRDARIEEMRRSMSPDVFRSEEEILRAQWAQEDAAAARAPIVQNQQAAEVARARLGATAQAGIPAITAEDLRRLAQTIATEAATDQGRQAVGNVIMNRARMNGQDIGSVVLAPGQFEVWQNGRAQRVDLSSPDGRRAMEIAEGVASGRLSDITGGADHFYSPRAQAALGRAAPGWATPNRFTGEIGGNAYYRLGRSPQAAYRAAYGVEGDLAAAGARYRQTNPDGDVGAYTLSEAVRMAAEQLQRFAQATGQTTIALVQAGEQMGATPYERGLAAAQAGVMPEVARARSVAATLRANGRGDEADELERAANGRLREAETVYNANLRVQFSDERRQMQGELADQRLMSGYWFSSQRMERDVGLQRYRRRLSENYGRALTGDESQEAERDYGALAELREQNRIMGMVRDSWFQLGNAAGQALERVILQGGKATDVLKALLAEMAAFYARAGSRLLMQGAMNAIGGLFGGTTAAPTNVGAGIDALGNFGIDITPAGAQGLILDARAFARPMAQGGGGIFAHAQFVPMANGGMALAGEAGPEAAVPLVRMPSGNLGVRTSGGGGAPAISNNFHVTVNGGGGGGGAGQGGGQRMGVEITRALEGMVTAVLVRQLAPGGVLTQAGGNPMMR